MGNLPGVTGVNDITVGGRARAGWVFTSQVRGTAAPQAAEWRPALELHVGHGQTSMGLGMVKLSQFLPCVVLARTAGQGGNSYGCSSRQGDKDQGRRWETW